MYYYAVNMKSVTVLGVLWTLMYNVKAQFGPETIMHILANTPGLSTFASWCGELDFLDAPNEGLTLFAFNDTGYNTLPNEDKRVLQSLTTQEKKDYVRSLTVNQTCQTAGLSEGQELFSVIGTRLYIDKKILQASKTTVSSKTFVNGELIVREDIQAINGVIHILERPLGPITNKTVIEYIKSYTEEATLPPLVNRVYNEYFSGVFSPLATESKMTYFLPDIRAVLKVKDESLSNLDEHVPKMHYIPGSVIFTNVVDHFRSFSSGIPQSKVILTKVNETVFVSCGKVTAQIMEGNIVLNKGVIHIVDKILGFAYNSVSEQISQDAKEFQRYLSDASPETRSMIHVSFGTEIHMFVPMDVAFQYEQNLSGNLDGDQKLIDKVIRLSIIRDAELFVLNMENVTYENRERRISQWNNMSVVIYNDANQMWVNGGNVRARIIRPDVGCIDGNLQYIDQLLGVPTMDIPTLIHHDDSLVLVYKEMVRVHLDEYLKDKNFDPNIFPPRGYVLKVNYKSSLGSHPSNRRVNDQTVNCTDRTSCVSKSGCQFTFFVPNVKALNDFYLQGQHAQSIIEDPCRFRYILRRLIIPNIYVSLEKMEVGHRLRVLSDTGDMITIKKEGINDVRIQWGQQSARAIMWDLGATNGIVHIIDQILSDPDD